MKFKIKQLLGLAAIVATLSACSGTLNLGITDAPIDGATEAVITFSGIELKNMGSSQYIAFDPPMSLNLLDLQGNLSAPLLQGQTLQAGLYQWMRLDVDESQSYIKLEDGTQHALTIPSDAQTGLKLISPFVIPPNGSADFTVDFDLRKSIHEPEAGSGSDYVLRPALRIVNNIAISSIAGLIPQQMLTDFACGAEEYGDVYLYEGFDAALTDIAGLSTDPISSATVLLSALGEYEYLLGFIP